ncbi:tyrosine recombinase xerD domain protein [Agrobacterium sp. RAC06]|nr:tyrosine recombinase xerD domain protein [Agrobacterium sp. RAC06]
MSVRFAISEAGIRRSAVGPVISTKVRILPLAKGDDRRIKTGMSQYNPAALGRPAWNAGKRVGVKKLLNMVYKSTGILRAIQILHGHTKIENTGRYLGVDIEDALELAERTEI